MASVEETAPQVATQDQVTGPNGVIFMLPTETQEAEMARLTGEFVRSETREILAEIGLPFDPITPEKDPALFDALLFLTRVIDRGSQKILPALPGIPPEFTGKIVNNRLVCTPLLSSFMAGVLTDPKFGLNYHVAGMVDIGNLFGANLASRLNGDRLIRTVAMELDRLYPKCVLVRWGGDEVMILAQKEGQYDPKKLEELKKINWLYRDVHLSPRLGVIQVAEKNFDDSMLQRDQSVQAPEGWPQARIDKLMRLHPELEFLRNLEVEPEKRDLIFEMLERSLVHPFLQPEAEKLSASNGHTVLVFHDFIDYIAHLTGQPEYQLESADPLLKGTLPKEMLRSDLTVTTITFPGSVKMINDQQSHAEGNRFIANNFRSMAQFLWETGRTDISIFCQGADFRMIGAPLTENESAQLKQRLGSVFAANDQTQFAVVPTVGTASVDLEIMGDKYKLAQFEAAVSGSSEKAWLDFLRNIHPQLDQPSPALAQHLIRYFDPFYSNRGQVHLNNARVDLNNPKLLGLYLKNQGTESWPAAAQQELLVILKEGITKRLSSTPQPGALELTSSPERT